MNRSELRKNIGKKFKFFPIPTRYSVSGSSQSDKNLWLLRREIPEEKGFEFLNLIGDYSPLVLDQLKINKFDEPDILILRGQIIFEGSSVRYEPFTPQPASLLAPNTNLYMFLEDAGEDGVAVISPPVFDTLRFGVRNAGEQTVRDYRNTIFIPQAFKRPTSQSYLGNLSNQGETTIEEQQYDVYGNLIQTPIYKDESIRIGQLILRADPGEYVFLWKIRCEDGVFPTDKSYGEIKVRVIPLSNLVQHAVEDLYNNL